MQLRVRGHSVNPWTLIETVCLAQSTLTSWSGPAGHTHQKSNASTVEPKKMAILTKSLWTRNFRICNGMGLPMKIRETQRRKNHYASRVFLEIFRKIGQKSKQQKTHISVAKCVRCFKDPARLRLARPISCIFSVGRVHHESLHGGVRKIFTFHRKIASIFHRKMVCVLLCSRKACEYFPSEKFSIFQPRGLTDSFGNPSHPLRKKETSRGVFTVWLGPGIHTSASFLAVSERHISF